MAFDLKDFMGTCATCVFTESPGICKANINDCKILNDLVVKDTYSKSKQGSTGCCAKYQYNPAVTEIWSF